ncbi:WGR domain-containing protein [Candidatus Parcubacteria bacterium]|nr:MAG: WGR domain-containing protein [Candidatus Parcubacteria bacterium]
MAHPSFSARWHKGTRYYELRVQQDLWGDWTISRIWGQRGSRLGSMKIEPYDSLEQAMRRYEELSKQRARKGYEMVRQNGK